MSDEQHNQRVQHKQTNFNFPEENSRAQKKESELKKMPTVWAMVVSVRVLLIVVILSLCAIPIFGVSLIYYEMAPYRATKTAEANSILIKEKAKAEKEAESIKENSP